MGYHKCQRPYQGWKNEFIAKTATEAEVNFIEVNFPGCAPNSLNERTIFYGNIFPRCNDYCLIWMIPCPFLNE